MNSHERTARQTVDEQYAICFVCSGNICRSPMAEVVLRAMVRDAGLDDAIRVDSAGTGEWHIGERADRRTVAALAAHGYDGSSHRARQFEPDWFSARDLVVALDRGHLRTLHAWAPTDRARQKLQLLRSFEPDLPRDALGRELDVPDPYYDGAEAFSEILVMIESACTGLLDSLLRDGVGRAARGRAAG
jgi:protein-tyrosine phosphatase